MEKNYENDDTLESWHCLMIICVLLKAQRDSV